MAQVNCVHYKLVNLLNQGAWRTCTLCLSPTNTARKHESLVRFGRSGFNRWIRMAQEKKKTKYAHLEVSHYFVPIAVESLGVCGLEAQSFFQDLSRRLKDSTSEPLFHYYLMQWISVAVQRDNTAAILGTLHTSLASEPLFPISKHLVVVIVFC